MYYKIPRASTDLMQIASPYPFAVWDIDLIDVLPTAKGGAKHTIGAID